MYGSESMQEHRAYEPPPYRPFSAMAVVSFVLALVAGIPALLMLWWAEIPAALLGAIAWGGTGPTGKRGRGLAIAATLIAVLAGIGSFAMQRAGVGALEDWFKPLATGLAKGDKVEAARWVREDEPTADVDAWIRRMDAAEERLGAFTGKVEIGDVWLGFWPAFIGIPDHGEEFGSPGAGQLHQFEAVWVRLVFEKGRAWMALRLSKGGQIQEDEARQIAEKATRHGEAKFVREVRLFAVR
jgi:hypothetical protein